MKKLENEPFAAKYCSNAIALKRAGSSIERISNTLYSSKITMTPHQIDAALFAFKSPTRKGVILADNREYLCSALILTTGTYLKSKTGGY